MSSGRDGDDHPGGGGITPRDTADTETDEFADEDKYACIRGDVGFEVKIKVGNRAICCSL